ncbi:Delta(14)-sterol reductase [Paramuricea clavata]|uniref:Delta(14)-sterol reductase n=1 Tax=Paramuricea clavata TaxID=317549 RepID=A0A6S7JKC1_PARCT|nr:Delta(14)-sterol reductase [Paramuricea clavata]
MGSYLSLEMFNSPYARAAILDMGIQWILCAISTILKTEKFYDLAGSSTFIYLTWQVLSWSRQFNTRQVIQSSCITAWAVRLGLFLFTRVLREGGDSRFNKVRDKPSMMLLFWTIQGVWVYMTTLPTLMLNTSKRNPPLAWKDYLGWSMWTVGFCIQLIADYQKTIFRSNPANHKKFITTGLWSIVRYPNYLGEILLWFGLYLPASSIMQGWQYLSIASPLFVAFLLTKVSGIPLQEAQARRRWSNDPVFQAYKAKTPKLFPGIW